MSEKFDIVLQGPLNDYAVGAALHYLRAEDIVNRVILSCWDVDPQITVDHPKCVIERSKSIDNPGMLNRNRQITTSLNGVRLVETDYAVKLRNDQKISLDSLRMMHDFYQQYKFAPPEVKANNRIGIASVYPAFPMHPRDHIFWGSKSDLISFFDIPFDTDALETCPEDYNRYTRCEVYIAMWYFALHYPDVKRFIDEPRVYLTDSAPCRIEAMKRGEEIFDKLFLTFPYIQLEWSKPRYTAWPYNDHCGGEYWDLGRKGTRHVW